MIAHDFPLTTPPIARDGADPLRLSLRPPHAVPDAEVEREIEAELTGRRDAYPRLVARGRLTEAAAVRHIAVWERIALAFDSTGPADGDAAWRRYCARRTAVRAAATVSPDDAVRELRRELAIRRAAWPKAIAAGRTTEAAARPRMEAIEAAHWAIALEQRHWDDLDYPPASGAPDHAAWLRWFRPQADAAAAAIWAGHVARTPAMAGYIRADERDHFKTAAARHATRLAAAQMEHAA